MATEYGNSANHYIEERQMWQAKHDTKNPAVRTRDKRIAELEAALRPFAKSYRVLKAAGLPRIVGAGARIVGAGGCTMQDFARAAKLVKD